MAESEYELLEKIGQGSFGVVHKVRRKSDGKILCRKEINYASMDQKTRVMLQTELSILSSLQHPNVVSYHQREHHKSSQSVHLYMEYCRNGDLASMISELRRKNEIATEDFVWNVFAQLASALYRCHYGMDAPDVGRNAAAVGRHARPTSADGKPLVTILHRDLKPDNIFLSEDNSVKLGDFGLAKIMQSHGFASSWVGTPFYMSPEIYAGESYTLRADIWSLGCVMYELCTLMPPFTAKTHIGLGQKIVAGRFHPLPTVYSLELRRAIESCLRVNPNERPETASLLNLPAIRLMRKEKEVVELGKLLKVKEAAAEKRMKEAREKELHLTAEKERMRIEIEAGLKQEWEVKARVEIDRQVQIEKEQLSKRFDVEVSAKVEEEVRQLAELWKAERLAWGIPPPDDVPLSSISGHAEKDFPSRTHMTELSQVSPDSPRASLQRKVTRTPFGRSQILFPGSPMDIQMMDPSPMSIASLSLSPRRNGPMIGGKPNIFAAAAIHNTVPGLAVRPSDGKGDDNGGMSRLRFPTHQQPSVNPFQTKRPPLISQKTAPVSKLKARHSFLSTTTREQSPQEMVSAPPSPADPLSSLSTSGAVSFRRTSPPHTSLPGQPIAPVASDTGSPFQKSKRPTRSTKSTGSRRSGGGEMFKTVTKSNMMKGRTLIELAQARGGEQMAGPSEVVKPQANLVDDRRRSRPKAVEVVWDPHTEEMPSPFLNRGTRLRRQR